MRGNHIRRDSRRMKAEWHESGYWGGALCAYGRFGCERRRDCACAGFCEIGRELAGVKG